MAIKTATPDVKVVTVPAFDGREIRKLLESKGLDVYSAKKQTRSTGAHTWWGARGTLHRDAGDKFSFIKVELISTGFQDEDKYLEAWITLEDAGYYTTYSDFKGLRVHPHLSQRTK